MTHVPAEELTTPDISLGDPKLYLISCTERPLETLAAVWINSRPTLFREYLDYLDRREGRRTPTASDVARDVDIPGSGIQPSLLVDLLTNVVTMSIPVSECVHFTWGWEHMPIAWREQAVRKRTIGFWITSAREFSMERFADDKRYSIPESVRDLPREDMLEVIQLFEDLYNRSQETYKRLQSKGLTQEDARLVIPSGAVHNGTMFTNLRSLLEITSSRSCWIAQVDLWAPILQAIQQELSRINPMLGIVITPPCYKPGDEVFQGCKYKQININRLGGEDPYMPCPIFINHLGEEGSAEVYRRLSLRVVSDHEQVWDQLSAIKPERQKYQRAAQRHLPIWNSIWKRDANGRRS